MPVIPTPNMLLPVPIVGVDPGPDYASNVNNCFFFVDSHDHSPGKGLRITPSGININADLTFGGFSATNVRAIGYNSQLAPITLLNSIYVVNGDLYFTDGGGNSFPITNAGGVAGTPGSIGSLVAPASVTYNVATQTFIFAATATQAANLDLANITLRNTTPPFNGVTVSPPLALPANYNIVLPTLPTGTDNIVVMDSSGNMSAPWKLDYSSINVNGLNQVFASAGIPDGVTVQNTGGTLNVREGDREHSWELNGTYPSLTYPLTEIDSIFFAPYNLTITGIWIYSATNGTTGTTEFDLKYKTSPSGAFTSIFSPTGKIAALTTLAPGALTSVGTTATVALNGHGFITGDSITIAGATPAGYNGTFTVTGYTLNSFTYTVPSGLATPATGTITLRTRSGVYTDSNSVVPSQAGVTKPVLLVSTIPAGSVIRFDLLQSMNTGATDARIRMWYRQAP